MSRQERVGRNLAGFEVPAALPVLEIGPSPRSERVASLYRSLSKDIDAGTFAAGAPLPSVRELVARYRPVSKDTVQGVLSLLVAVGYLERRNRRRFIVLPESRRSFEPLSVVMMDEGTREHLAALATQHGEDEVVRVFQRGLHEIMAMRLTPSVPSGGTEKGES